MTALDPSIHALDSPGRTDQLGTALQQGLPRPMNPRLSWGLIKTFLIGGISGGILPTLILPKRFHDFATAEQLQFWYLAEWVRLQAGGPEATAASELAHRIAPGFVMRLAATIFTLVAIGIGWTALQQAKPAIPSWFALTLPQLSQDKFSHEARGLQRGESAEQMWRDFYRRHSAGVAVSGGSGWHTDNAVHSIGAGGNNSRDLHAPADLVNAYALAMAGAALCWLIGVNAHIGRVSRFVGAFNQLSNRYGVGPVRPPGLHLGIRPLWLLGAAAMCTIGAFWAVPVLLAAAAQRRYIRSTSQRLRSDLARRQREVLLRQRPTLRVPTSVYLMGACPQPNCRAPLPPEATFCRRCGTRTSGGGEVVNG